MRKIFYLILAIIVVGLIVVYFLSKKKAPIEKEELEKKPELVVKKEEKKEEAKAIPKVEVPKKEAIKEKIEEKNPYRQAEAIADLEVQGGNESINQIEGYLGSPTPSTIIEAVGALGRLQAKDSINQLEDLYQNSIVRVDGYGQPIRTAIIDALGNIKDETAVDFLGEQFKLGEGLMYDDHLLDAFDQIGSKQSLPYLEEYLRYLEANPGPEDFSDLRFLINEAKKKTERIIQEIKEK